MTKELSGIYCILNTVNNKFYIGSSKNCDDRFSKHLSSLRGNYHANSYLQNSFNKYGEESFKMFVLEQTLDLKKREQYWIDITNPSYNITREVIRNTPSIESRKKHSETKKLLHSQGLLPRTTKAVKMYDLEANFIREFNSLNEAAEFTNLHVTTIIRNLDKTYNRAGKYLFKYSTDNNDIIPYQKRIYKKWNKNSRDVLLINILNNDVKEFKSVPLLAEYLNTSTNNIIQYVKKHLIYKKTYKVQYKNSSNSPL